MKLVPILVIGVVIVTLIVTGVIIMNKNSDKTQAVNNVQNIYKQALIDGLEYTEDDVKELDENINIVSNCIVDRLSKSRSLKDISNLDKEALSRLFVELNIDCDENQLQIARFLKIEYPECPPGKIISYIKQYINKGEKKLNQLRKEDDLEDENEKESVKNFMKEDCVTRGRCFIDQDCNYITGGAVCQDNFCTCESPNGLCNDNNCVDFTTDQNNCGSCGNACEDTKTCQGGLCQ